MARGAVRGAATAWLALIALQAVSTRGGSGRIAALLTDVNGLIERALDPNVPAIPDRRTGGTTSPVRPVLPTHLDDPSRPERLPIPGQPRPS